jgi:hypothetical protein
MKTKLLFTAILLINFIAQSFIVSAQELAIKIGDVNVTCFGYSNGLADLVVVGGTAPYTYLWSNGSTNEDLVNIPSGGYSVTVTDMANVSVTMSTTITEPSDMVLNLSSNGFNCNNNSGEIVVSAQGGTSPYVGTGTYTVSNTGIFSYTVIDAKYCLKTDSIEIFTVLGDVPEMPEFDLVPSTYQFDQPLNFSVTNLNCNITWVMPYGSVVSRGQGTSNITAKFSQSFTGGYIEVYAENRCGISEVNQYYVEPIATLSSAAVSTLSVDVTPVFGNKSMLPGDIAFHDNLTTATFRDTVKQGDDYYFEVVVQNFSQNVMDSVYLKYYLSDNPHDYNNVLITPMEPGEERTLPVLIIPTQYLTDNQELVLQLNPDELQAELNHGNNLLTVPFVVKEFTVSPIQTITVQNRIYNYPNPVTSQTQFHISLNSNFSNTDEVEIYIHDSKGQLLKSFGTEFCTNLGNGSFVSQSWDVANDGIGSGTYVYTVVAKNNAGRIEKFSSKMFVTL